MAGLARERERDDGRPLASTAPHRPFLRRPILFSLLALPCSLFSLSLARSLALVSAGAPLTPLSCARFRAHECAGLSGTQRARTKRGLASTSEWMSQRRRREQEQRSAFFSSSSSSKSILPSSLSHLSLLHLSRFFIFSQTGTAEKRVTSLISAK